jgi:Protein of unknown function (DUF2934)
MMAEAKSRTPAKKAAPAKSAAKAAPAKSSAAKPAAKKTTAAKPVAKKTTVAKPAASKPAAKKISPAKATSAQKGNGITAEQRYRMIAEAAYYIAEKRGFAPGDPSRDWADAEAQIRVMFSA